MFSIVPHNLHWLASLAAEDDLCAHGGVLVTHDGHVLVDDRSENWALGAAALFLLRTLVYDHTPQVRVTEHLFPCCGHAMYVQEGSDQVLIPGCPNGRDWEVRHRGDEVDLTFEKESQVHVSKVEWRTAVLHFSDAVEEFYAGSEPKRPSGPDEVAGYNAFRAEWLHRARHARGAA